MRHIYCDDVEQMAAVVYELVKLGLTFEVFPPNPGSKSGTRWEIRLTGGY